MATHALKAHGGIEADTWVRTAITNATRTRPEPGRTAGAEAGGDAAIVDPKSFVAGFVLATHDLREPIVEIGPSGFWSRISRAFQARRQCFIFRSRCLAART